MPVVETGHSRLGLRPTGPFWARLSSVPACPGLRHTGRLPLAMEGNSDFFTFLAGRSFLFPPLPSSAKKTNLLGFPCFVLVLFVFHLSIVDLKRSRDQNEHTSRSRPWSCRPVGLVSLPFVACLRSAFPDVPRTLADGALTLSPFALALLAYGRVGKVLVETR